MSIVGTVVIAGIFVGLFGFVLAGAWTTRKPPPQDDGPGQATWQ